MMKNSVGVSRRNFFFIIFSIFFSPEKNRVGPVILWKFRYEGESISNQPILFPIDRDGHDFHALFQYMFYTWVQNCTRIESFFNKILNVNHGQ